MTIEVGVEVGVPVRTAYDRWVRFEGFPRFMPWVRRVEQVRPNVTRWWVGKGPLRHEFYTEVTEQHPDALVSWRSLDDRLPHEGAVTFEPLGEERTRMTLRVELGDGALARRAAPVVRRVVESHLACFATFVEGVGDAGETWRGTIRRGRVTDIQRTPPAHPGWVHG